MQIDVRISIQTKQPPESQSYYDVKYGRPGFSIQLWHLSVPGSHQCLLSRLKKTTLFMCPRRTCFDSQKGPFSCVFLYEPGSTC